MNAAGIDVSSRKSTVAVLRPFGEVVKLPFDVRHSAEDLAALAEQLKSIDGETRVVMEHTGRYYESVAKVLHEAGLYVSAVNPLLIKEYDPHYSFDGSEDLKLANIPQRALSHNYPTASATVDKNEVTMLEDNGSANAEVPLTVKNTKGFDLPKTGDHGTWMYSLVGILLMSAAAGVIVLTTRKKNGR